MEDRHYPKLGKSVLGDIFEAPPWILFRTASQEREVIQRIVEGFTENQKNTVLTALESGDADTIAACTLPFKIHPGDDTRHAVQFSKIIPRTTRADWGAKLTFLFHYLGTTVFLWWGTFWTVQLSLGNFSPTDKGRAIVSQYVASGSIGSNRTELDMVGRAMDETLTLGSLVPIALWFAFFSFYALFFVVRFQLRRKLDHWTAAARALEPTASSVMDGKIVDFLWESKGLMRWRRHLKIARFFYFVGGVLLIFGSWHWVLNTQAADGYQLASSIALFAGAFWVLYLHQRTNYLWWYYTTNADPSTALSINFMRTVHEYSSMPVK